MGQLDTSDARELFNLLDVDENEEIGIEEFILGCKRLRGQAKSSDVATLIRESKKTSAKSMRVMRKMEAQLGALCSFFQGAAGMDGSHASWLRSPLSGGTLTPASEFSPAHSRTPHRANRRVPMSRSVPDIYRM